MNVKSIEELEISERILFIRTDYDFDINSESKGINFKIDCSLPTIKYALEQGSRVVIASHRSVKDHKYSQKYSLRCVGDMLSEKLNTNIYFPENCIGDAVKKIKQDMNSGQVMLLENLMFYKDEINNEPGFSRKLSENIDVYVSESFGLLTKAFSSNLGVLDYIKDRCAGCSFKKEMELLENLKKSSKKPFVAYFSGGDIYSKIELLEQMTDEIDILILDGFFASTLLKSIGYEIAKDGYDSASIYRIKKLYDSMVARNKKIAVPEDFCVSYKIENSKTVSIVDRSKLKDKFKITGVGELTKDIYSKIISNAQTILWDGKTGYDDIIPSSLESNPIYNSLINSDSQVVVITDFDYFSNNLMPYNEKLQISYNIESAYAYLKGEHLPALEILRS
jgi:3-phosphoglycerate kinase